MSTPPPLHGHTTMAMHHVTTPLPPRHAVFRQPSITQFCSDACGGSDRTKKTKTGSIHSSYVLLLLRFYWRNRTRKLNESKPTAALRSSRSNRLCIFQPIHPQFSTFFSSFSLFAWRDIDQTKKQKTKQNITTQLLPAAEEEASTNRSI